MASGGFATNFVRTDFGRVTSWGDLGARISGLSTGGRFYVDSATGSDSNDGTTPTTAKATIESAIQLCTPNKGDIIYAMPTHNEGAGDAQIFDADIAGISIIAMQGAYGQRPILDYDHANATIDVGANNILISGFRLRPSVTGVLIGVDIETSVTGTILHDCEWINGEDGAGVDEFAKAIHLTSANHDTAMIDLVIRSHVSAAGSTHAIHVDAASDRCVYPNVAIDGPWATNGILEDAASADTTVENCTIDVTGTNYGFVSTSTYTRFHNNRGAEGRTVNKLGQEWYPGFGYRVSKTEDGNTATSDDLFTLTGKVNIRLWTMEVTNALGATAKFSDYQITLTTLNGVLVAAGDISSAAIGFMRTLNADAGDTALSTSTGAVTVTGVGDSQGKTGHLVVGKAGGSDVIKSVRTAGDSGDAIIHLVFYEPLESGASLVAAA